MNSGSLIDLVSIPLQDDDCSKHEHPTYSCAVELQEILLMNVFEYSRKSQKKRQISVEKQKYMPALSFMIKCT